MSLLCFFSSSCCFSFHVHKRWVISFDIANEKNKKTQKFSVDFKRGEKEREGQNILFHSLSFSTAEKLNSFDFVPAQMLCVLAEWWQMLTPRVWVSLRLFYSREKSTKIKFKMWRENSTTDFSFWVFTDFSFAFTTFSKDFQSIFCTTSH